MKRRCLLPVLVSPSLLDLLFPHFQNSRRSLVVPYFQLRLIPVASNMAFLSVKRTASLALLFASLHLSRLVLPKRHLAKVLTSFPNDSPYSRSSAHHRSSVLPPSALGIGILALGQAHLPPGRLPVQQRWRGLDTPEQVKLRLHGCAPVVLP